ncbi:uncharacterized protein LOC115885471 isoform X2 [Sitophilus oryzae]|uniref:Uncharacterized protein LOC115885471 isoform X2 n=1 Tax=Sitophilus oryzae TaxID=7048 RepID=A0A6J2YAP3_SITOR|nr:uncharacterized protein LOC115885471 isoform X2 [Sitophilus oryzae]
MLRTRRRDNNVKPNRRDSSFKSRLDRKSSRGMLYENEELRLKTININAEIERGQSDIKKLKRENEMLKKEIWCLRDEYDKLDKLLKDKKMDFSSSSTTYSSTSDSESCSSCTEESEEVETSQNIQNVQKTNLKNLRNQFDHLSIVTEETSCENSDRNSVNTRQSVNNDHTDNLMWNYNDKEAIKPDQSYPVYGLVTQNRSQTLPNQANLNYFSPIQHSKSFDDNHFNQAHHEPIYPEEYYNPTLSCQTNIPSQTPPIAISPSPPPHYENQQVVYTGPEKDSFLSKKIVQTNASNFYQNMVLVPKNHRKSPVEIKGLEKKATDLIVKIDNQNFSKNLTYSNTTPSTTFSNGGNLEELLHDIESISQDILKLTHLQRGIQQCTMPTIQEPILENPFYGTQGQGHDLPYPSDSILNRLMNESINSEIQQMTASQERLHKSELNVVLMPKAMPLIGFDKYKNIHRSLDSLDSKQLENMSASQQNLCLIPPPPEPVESDSPHPVLHVNLPVPPTPYPVTSSPNYSTSKMENQEHNPFFFGNLNDNYVNSDYFNRRYNPDNFIHKTTPETAVPVVLTPLNEARQDKSSVVQHSDHVVENEENIKLKTSKPETRDKEKRDNVVSSSSEKKKDNGKSPKLSITRKVSIHFKGKKEKEKLKKLAMENSSPETKSSSSKTIQDGKKLSLFDFRVNNDTSKEKLESKDPTTPKPSKHNEKPSKLFHQKTPSIESRKSTTETSNFDPKTPNSTTDSDRKNAEKREKDAVSKKEDKKGRKSVSVSPDRIKHVHLMHEGSGMKKHKKHRRERSGASRTHRASIDPRFRERSYSICTDRSLVGPAGLGLGYGSFLYDEYSDRERTNSGSSCESQQHDHHRKMSSISNVPVNGKVPWCGCWGNGCL